MKTDTLSNLEKEKEAVVTSCMPLSQKQLDDLKKILYQIHKKDFILVNKTDKNLIGGFTVRVADWYFDASLLQQLIRLKEKLFSK